MHIRRIKIKDVRGFETLDLDLRRPDGSLAGWTVFAGRNGSGKSTLLQAVALAVVGPTPARALQESFSDWVQAGASKASVELEMRVGQQDQARIDHHPGGLFTASRIVREAADAEDRPEDVMTTRLHWTANGSGEPTLQVELRHSGRFKTESERDYGPWSENTDGWLLAGYGPFRRLSGHGADAQRLMSGPKRVARLVSLFREDASLVECVQWLREIYLLQLEGDDAAERLLNQIFDLLNDGLLPDGVHVDRFDSKGLWVTQHGHRLALDTLSDGYRAAAALVIDLVRHLDHDHHRLEFKRDPGGHLCVITEGVVLIDEMELHLHVSWQKRIGFWLKDHFPGIQFLVTTHSPFLCQAADPGGLVRMPVPGEARQAEKVPDDVYYTVVHGSVDDTVLTELFGLDMVHSEQAELLHQRVAKLEVRRQQEQASPEEEDELEMLRRQLPRSPMTDVDQVLRRLTVR